MVRSKTATRRKRKSGPKKVESLKHKDKRKNIPTEELRDFVVEDEESPKTLLYPRDPSLDPQLVWKGKDEQDREDLPVPVVPVYIQEKIHPHAIVEDVRREAEKGPAEREQLSLFSDFNGIDFEQQIEFYQHEQNWSNRMILGDSLLVMTSLAEKEGLKGKVQMIYIDPPYGIKFGSNWQVSTKKRDVKDGKAEDTTRQPEQVRAFRDTWKLGIHSYLSYLRDRLVVARDLLTDTGSVFVQIGDENAHLVRCVLDEVLGSENCCGVIIYVTTSTQGSGLLPVVNDYLLWYGKVRDQVKYRPLYEIKTFGASGSSGYNFLEMADGTRRRLSKSEITNGAAVAEGQKLFAASDLTSSHYSISEPIEIGGKEYTPGHRYWSTSTEGMCRLRDAGRLLEVGNSLRFKRYFDDFPAFPRSNVWTDTGIAGFSSDRKVYVVQTNEKVVSRCLLMSTDPGDLVLDPTCGSGTTAYVAEKWGRRWITVDTSRVALALARTRLMAARYPYYVLADSEEGLQLEAEISGKRPRDVKTEHDIKKGFVYEQVPHVTLKSIANNPDIKEGMSREEIDQAIARHAEKETLYDKPYQDKKKVRVTGPFTVESLSPHRVISVDQERPDSEKRAEEDVSAPDFVTSIIDNLKTAGVQNTVRNERLKFDRLEPYAGTYIQATGEYTENGKSKRVAVCIGPEHGTVGPDLVKEAAKEAVQGVGFDLLIVCGFAFDPHVTEEAKRYGKLQVLITRMNPDLSTGMGELLKKTGTGNLFMVFGEPDLDVKKTKNGKITVEIKGVDVYDPTTGQIRSSSTDDIACWFIDTDYNGESFFVRHAYFTGGDKPYDKLRRALRAEIDEAAWAALYSTTSRPFDPPSTGRIAVKVINHYGDEVLKVYDVDTAKGKH